MQELSGAADTNWPLPRWPGPRLEQLTAETSATERDAFKALLAHAKILGSTGLISEAQKLLQMAQLRYPAKTTHWSHFRDLISTAILVHDVGSARAWLLDRFKSSYDLEIDFFKSDASPEVVRLQIHKNKVRFLFNDSLFSYIRSEHLLERWVATYSLFDTFIMSPHRIDGSVDINVGDGGLRPGLAFCDHKPGYYLIPDALYMIGERYVQWANNVRANSVPWADRKPVAFWRGSTGGHPTDPALGWRSLPRIRLCEIGCANPELIDAGITLIAQVTDATARDWLEKHNMMRQHLSGHSFQKSYQQYRYQIDIDGNTNSWPGLFVKLLSGSPVLKVGSRKGYQQWYYDRLKPWINYVPVESDMADLVEKISWLRENDDAARKIGEAGLDLAEALTDEQEIVRAAPVIAAAIRAAAKEPLVDLRFTTGAQANMALQTGWHEPEADGVRAAGFEGRVVLPKPPGLGDFILIADVSPTVRTPQRLTIMTNGELLLRKSITERTTVYCPLPRSVVDASETLDLGFFFPDSKICASAINPLDHRMLSLTLHRVSVAAAHCYTGDEHPDIAAALVGMKAAPTRLVVHDLWRQRSPLPSSVKLQTLRTIHGTILYADLHASRVRHGPEAKVPRNLFLVQENIAASLMRVDRWGGTFAIRLRPEGPYVAAPEGTRQATDGFVEGFEIVTVDNSAQNTIALRGAELFVCAEKNGELTLSRQKAAGWEHFHIELGGS